MLCVTRAREKRARYAARMATSSNSRAHFLFQSLSSVESSVSIQSSLVIIRAQMKSITNSSHEVSTIGCSGQTRGLIRSSSIAARSRVFHLFHRFVDGFLHAQSVRTLAWREFLETLKMSREERSRSGRGPQLLREEQPSDIAEFRRIRRHFFHRVHQQVHDIRNAGIDLRVEPVVVHFDADVHFPTVNS